MKYALINNAKGYLENIVLYDGDTSKWQPPAGVTAVPLDNIDLAALPPKPNEAPAYTAEAWVAQTLTPLQVAALSEFRMALLQAGKPLGPNMTALKSWLESMMAESVDPTPRIFAAAPCSYEDAASEALLALQQ